MLASQGRPPLRGGRRGAAFLAVVAAAVLALAACALLAVNAGVTLLSDPGTGLFWGDALKGLQQGGDEV